MKKEYIVCAVISLIVTVASNWSVGTAKLYMEKDIKVRAHKSKWVGQRIYDLTINELGMKVFNACRADLEQSCSNYPSLFQGKFRCLVEKYDGLENNCQDELTNWIVENDKINIRANNSASFEKFCKQDVEKLCFDKVDSRRHYRLFVPCLMKNWDQLSHDCRDLTTKREEKVAFSRELISKTNCTNDLNRLCSSVPESERDFSLKTQCLFGNWSEGLSNSCKEDLLVIIEGQREYKRSEMIHSMNGPYMFLN